MTALPLPGLAASFFETPLGVIARAAREAVVVVDQQQRIVALNPAAQRMFLYTSSSALGQPLSNLIPPSLRAAHDRHVQQFDASGVIERVMRAHCRRDAAGVARTRRWLFAAAADASVATWPEGSRWPLERVERLRAWAERAGDGSLAGSWHPMTAASASAREEGRAMRCTRGLTRRPARRGGGPPS